MNIKQIDNMMHLQDQMNKNVDKNWRDNKWNWLRAVRVESMEMLDHYGWKWWKHQEPDIEQVKLELIDIIHFMLSEALQRGYFDSSSVKHFIEMGINQYNNIDDNQELFRNYIERLIRYSFDDQFADMWIIIGYMILMLKMDFNEVYKMYIGKNVLNNFRQEHGYKNGTYVKEWNGREDNEHLTEIMNKLDSDSETFIEDLWTDLENSYKEATG